MGITVRQKQPGEGNPWWIFINDKGKRKARKIGDKETAEKVATELREKLEGGDLEISGKKFRAYAGEWFKTHVQTFLKHSTSVGYEVCLRRHILPVFGSKQAHSSGIWLQTH